MVDKKYTVLEICAGGGGQALGLEQSGFITSCAVEIDRDACETLKLNRPSWEVINADLTDFQRHHTRSRFICRWCTMSTFLHNLGKQLGADDDERDLFLLH